jgi:hypothetical protein
MESFESIFKEQYDTIHRLETNKLRNVAKMFAHLLYTDSLPWSVSSWVNIYTSVLILYYSQICTNYNLAVLILLGNMN